MVREGLGDLLEHSAEGKVDELVLREDALAVLGLYVGDLVVGGRADLAGHAVAARTRSRAACLASRGGSSGLRARFPRLPLAEERDELREHDRRVLDLARPALHPLKRDETRVPTGGQGVERFRERKVALAGHAVVDGARAVDDGILHVDVLDPPVEVFPGSLGALAEEAEGVMDVPERGDRVASDRVEEAREPLRVGVDAVRLDEEGHAARLCADGEPLQDRDDFSVVDLTRGRGMRVGEHADEGRARLGGEVDIFPDLGRRGLSAVLGGKHAVR